MYRVSPQLFVTKEHIISDSASTSVSSFCDPGDVAAVRGLIEWVSIRGDGWWLWGAVFGWVCVPDAFGVLLVFCFCDDGGFPAFSPLVNDRSARRFSSVPRSVFPPSSCDKRPESRSSDSIRPNRFSNPSMYLALYEYQASALCRQNAHVRHRSFWTYPFGGFRFFSTCVKTQSVL